MFLRCKKEKYFIVFLSLLEKNGYKVTYKVVYAPDYGVPQTRKRLLLLASKFGDISLIEPEFNSDTHPTLRDTIGKLPEIRAEKFMKMIHYIEVEIYQI